MTEAEWQDALSAALPDLEVVCQRNGSQLITTLSRDEYETHVLYDLDGLELALVVVNSRLLTSDWPSP